MDIALFPSKKENQGNKYLIKYRFESLLLGKIEFVAEHAGLLYAMETNDKLLQFMR